MSLSYLQWNSALGHYVRVNPPADITRNTNVARRSFNRNVGKGREQSNGCTEYTGVTYDAKTRRWRAYITINGTFISLGCYDTDRDAALAYDREAIKLGRPTNILKPQPPKKP